jgi:cytoskeleton protein RodZ
MSDVAQALGLKLKAERERRGVSAQKMADDLHLDGWVIEALEAGDYQRIGPSVYAKGHLKKYAALLGVSAVDSPAPPEPKPAVNAPVPIIRLDQPEPPRLGRPVLAGAVVTVALVAGIVWRHPWHSAGSKPSAAAPRAALRPSASIAGDAPAAVSGTAPEAASLAESAAPSGPRSIAAAPSNAVPRNAVPSNAAPSRTPEATPIPTEFPVQRPAVPVPSSPAPAVNADLTPGVGRARLRLSFSADSRVDVYDYSGKPIFTGNGRANSVKTIAGIAPFRVYLGFASGVQLEVNDRAVAIGPQFVSGDVARFEAGADGVLRRDTRAAPTNGAPAVAASPRG